MKRFTFLMILATAMLFSFNSRAQRTCASNDHMLDQLQNSPKMQEKINELEDYTKNYVQNFTNKAGETRLVPVHVIVVYSNSQENISDAQIQSQITVLNQDYGGTNSDNNPPAEFAAVGAGNTGIQFVLSGIERHSDATSSWGTNDAVKSAYPPTSPTTTLNMWICNIGGGILGYAQFPGGAASTDGVVFSPQYCGSIDYNDGSFYLSAPFDKGRTATHEIGHYFNLRHIWGDGNCGADDYVDDTPIAGAANYGCPTYPSKSCTSNGGWTSDQFMNYMDYTDDPCMYMFSAGQSARMWACLNSSRLDLGTSGGNLAPTANANGTYTGDPGVAVSFSSTGSSDSDGTIVSYSWSFGDGATSTSANPSHTYSSAGVYNVSLTVTDDGGATGTDNTTATIGTVCSGTQACDGNVTLTLTTDRYASETSWTLKNSAGTTVESGSGYSNSTTYTLNWTLSEDTYTFTINDSYGDGICCSYGSGSYALNDGCGADLGNGGSFTTSESKVFCVPATAPPVNQAPVANANGPYSAYENVSISFSSTGSSDSDGSITGYSWNFGDGATSTAANPSHSYASAGTYTVSLTVTDNDGATGNNQTTASITVAPANVAPTANANGPYSADENISISFSSAGSSDSDGSITGYSWSFGDGATSTAANPSHAYASAGTYTVSLTVTDNDGATGNDQTTATITVAPPTTTVTLEATDFESGKGIWIDGGKDCSFYTTGSRAWSGSNAFDIQDNSGIASSFYTNENFNVTAYNSIDIEFYFYAYSMEYGEDFWVQYFDGSSWKTVASYARGTSFNNSTFYVATITISNTNYNFPSNAEFRFMCDASANYDDVYIDDITITATSGTARTSGNTLTPLGNSFREMNLLNEDGLRIYPNPATSELTIETGIEDNSVVNIYSYTGALVKTMNLKQDVTTINISNLTPGIYFIKVNNGEEVYTNKLIKQ
ncbi:MAG: PKD domain-containing protein [Chlorobi bacterium]|nr:PKD domain-containing protein [Chlorobiota bacterium]